MRYRALIGIVFLPFILSCKKDPSLTPADPKVTADERDKLQGAWIHTQITMHGKNATPEVTKRFVMRFDGERFTIMNGEKQQSEGTFQIDPTKEPKEIDLHESTGVNIYGIYTLNGDELSICQHEKKRPSEFSADAGSGKVLLRMSRQKP